MIVWLFLCTIHDDDDDDDGDDDRDDDEERAVARPLASQGERRCKLARSCVSVAT